MIPLKTKLFFCLLLGSGLLVSCHYQFGYGELSQLYATISVPYAEGDRSGELTQLVIKKISTAGAFRYMSQGGDLILKIKLIDLSEQNVGFHYDRKKNGKLKKSLIPTETRLSAIAEVTLTERGTGQVIQGPTRLMASIEFDHTYYATRDELNIFSLGQLNDIDAARDAAMHPLNLQLADKIVDYMMHTW